MGITLYADMGKGTDFDLHATGKYFRMLAVICLLNMIIFIIVMNPPFEAINLTWYGFAIPVTAILLITVLYLYPIYHISQVLFDKSERYVLMGVYLLNIVMLVVASFLAYPLLLKFRQDTTPLTINLTPALSDQEYNLMQLYIALHDWSIIFIFILFSVFTILIWRKSKQQGISQFNKVNLVFLAYLLFALELIIYRFGQESGPYWQLIRLLIIVLLPIIIVAPVISSIVFYKIGNNLRLSTSATT